MSEMKELSKSTSNLMTGGISMPKFKKKRPKSDSKASLLRSSQDSLSTISVNITIFIVGYLIPSVILPYTYFILQPKYVQSVFSL